MDYADKLQAFTSNFDEAKSTFYTGQDLKAGAGALKEKAGSAAEQIGLPTAGIAYKAAAKLGLNDVAEGVVKQVTAKGVQVAKQAVSSVVGGDAPASNSATTSFSNPAFEEGGDAVVEPALGSTVAEGAGEDLALEAGADIGGAALAATLGAAIPVIGGIAALAYGIVKLVRGHHEEVNNQKKFTFDPSMDAAPVYTPGQR